MKKKKRKNELGTKRTDFIQPLKTDDKGSVPSKNVIEVVAESSGTSKKIVEVTIESSGEKIDLLEFIEAVLDFEDG